MRASLFIFVSIAALSVLAIRAQERAIADDFEGDVRERWQVSVPARVHTVASNDPAHNRVLLLEPDGDDVYAILKSTAGWPGARFEADVQFPTNENNYLAVIYNFRQRGSRLDFGDIYIKGNESYLQANPHRDLNVGRTLYPEYRVPLTGPAAIKTGAWQHIKVEVVRSMCHFYVGDMTTPQMTFDAFEGESGALGLQPRSVGGPVWVDNVRVEPIDRLAYAGAPMPAAYAYAPDALLTNWDVIGPLTATDDEIGRHGPGLSRSWRPFVVDRRGAVVTAGVVDFHGPATVAYFRTRVVAPAAKTATFEVSSIDDLAVWVNGRFTWFLDRGGSAWYDFATNERHAGQKIPIDLRAGSNEIVVRVRGGAYAAGGFFARLVP